jgi:hypothetical protein
MLISTPLDMYPEVIAKNLLIIFYLKSVLFNINIAIQGLS